jgi:hypothetical protein
MSSAILAVLIGSLTSTSSWTLAEIVQGDGLFPSLRSVQKAAAKLIPVTSNRQWAHRARLRGALPQVEVSFGTDLDQDVRVSVGHSESTFEGREYGFKLKARWHLSSLMFDSAELRAHRERRSSAAARRLLIDEVTQMYFNRVELMFLPTTVHRELKAARLEGRMHALTGGEYFGGSDDR